jgi:hypothetical protein
MIIFYFLIRQMIKCNLKSQLRDNLNTKENSFTIEGKSIYIDVIHHLV